MKRSETFWKWFDEVAPSLDQWRGMHRSKSFRAMFEYLETLNGPYVNIVETGCIGGVGPDQWAGNGCSTVLFDKFVATHPGSTATSIELISDRVEEARPLCPNVTFHCGDSVEILKNLAEAELDTIDLLYLDASHHDWKNETPSQVHHYNELMAAMPRLNMRSMVAVDDSISLVDDYPMTRILGKGGLVAQYALEIGATMHFCQYQIGFTDMTARYPSTPHQIEHTIERARKLVEEGRRDAADRLYRVILAVTPQPWDGKTRVARGEAYANFGRTAHKLRTFGRAVDWFRYALNSDPLAAEYRCDLVRSLVALGAMESAKREATIASEIDPNNPSVWACFGGVESDMRNEAGTIFAYDKQIETAKKLDPPDLAVLSDSLLNRAVIALDVKDYELARELATHMIEMRVRAGDAWHVLAILEYRFANHEKSIEYFDKALAANCRNQPLTHWNRSLPLQSIGRFKEAFEEHAWGEHEQTVTAIYVPHHRFTKPHWRGQKNCTVHVHTEAGHGDNILMMRYLPLFKDLGCTVRYECDPLLLGLAKRSFPDIEMMPRAKDYPGALGIKDFDYHLPIGELPHRFGTDIDNIPWNGPYIKPDPALSAKTRQRLFDRMSNKELHQRKIGLCWSSGIRVDMNIWMEKYGRLKSMSFADMAPIADGDYTFVSLQVGDGRSENNNYAIDYLPEKPNWDDTAALIDNLDLVITVDTGVAHLAGAMGKPTWVIMQKDGASYHFLCERPGASWNTTNPWYPSIRVFRQHQVGDWSGVVAEVAQELQQTAFMAAAE